MKKIILILISIFFMFCGNNENISEDNVIKEYTYKIEELKIKSGNNEIWGQIYTPDNLKKRAKTIIISHGFNGSYEFGLYYAEELVKKGYVVYVFDYINGSTISKSGNNTREMSIFDQVRQLKDVSFELIKQKYVDKDNLYLIGHSQGGLVSAIMASENKDIIKGLVLLAPGFAIADYISQFFESAGNIPESSTFLNATVGRKYIEELLGFDVFEKVIKFDKKVLIIHGIEDEIAPIEYSKKAIEVYNNAKMIEIKGGNHSFDREGDKKIIMDFAL